MEQPRHGILRFHQLPSKSAACSPCHILAQPLQSHAIARFGLRTRARSIIAAPASISLKSESEAGKASRILEETMTEAFSLTFPGAPTTGGVVEIKCGPSWGELKALEE